MSRFVALGQLIFVLGCVGYSTYALFLGDFQQAFLPYPILILYYLVFARRKATGKDEEGEKEREGASGS